MTPLWHSAWKDVRAIGPIWLACAVAAAAAPIWHAARLDAVAVIAYVLGAVAIGAHVVGHEHSHRTLDTLLAQPVRRTTTLAVKLGVLMVALLTLTAIAAAGPGSPIRSLPAPTTLDTRVIYLPTLMGLTLAPYLALVARSTLGGAVFSIAIPGLLLIAGDVIGLAIYGFALPGEVDQFKYRFFPASTLAACAVAALALWPRFARLEVLGDSHGYFSLPFAAGTSAAHPAWSPRHPLWLLAIKELRLQQMVFVIAALNVLVALGLAWFQRSRALAPPIPWPQLIMLYGCLVSMLIGGLASAEERQLGTLEWQSLMPISRRTQFAVKVAVVLGVAMVFTVILPVALLGAMAGSTRSAIPSGFLPWLCMGTIASALGGLYVSSLSSSGVKAVALAVPFVASGLLLLRSARMVFWFGVAAGVFDRHWLPQRRLTETQTELIGAGALAAIGVVLLLAAQRNHWSVSRTATGVAAQIAGLAGVVAAAGIGIFLLGFR